MLFVLQLSLNEDILLADSTGVILPHRKHVDGVTLDQLEVGQHGKVLGVSGERDVRRRLLEMGFTHGAAVQVIRRAPLGDPIEYQLRGYHLSLRADQAKHVGVSRVRGSGFEVQEGGRHR